MAIMSNEIRINNNKHGGSDNIQTFIINHEGQVANVVHEVVNLN